VVLLLFVLDLDGRGTLEDDGYEDDDGVDEVGNDVEKDSGIVEEVGIEVLVVVEGSELTNGIDGGIEDESGCETSAELLILEVSLTVSEVFNSFVPSFEELVISTVLNPITDPGPIAGPASPLAIALATASAAPDPPDVAAAAKAPVIIYTTQVVRFVVADVPVVVVVAVVANGFEDPMGMLLFGADVDDDSDESS